MKLLKKQKGSAILTTIFILFGILSISMIGLNIIMSGMAARKAQGASTRAFYAAESGIERAMMAFKLDKSNALFDSLGANTCFLRFCNENDGNCDTIATNDQGTEIDSSVVICGADKQVYYLNKELTNPSYWVKVNRADINGASNNGRNVQLSSQGNYQNTSRQLFVSFCLPDCAGKAAGDNDGCGGSCK